MKKTEPHVEKCFISTTRKYRKKTNNNKEIPKTHGVPHTYEIISSKAISLTRYKNLLHVFIDKNLDDK